MLPVSRLIKVSVNLGATPAVGRSFNTLCIAGDSNVISGTERIRAYANFADVEADFGVSAPETLAAQLYFGQSPQPTSLQIGRWFSAASSGFNLGGILTAAQQVLSNWTGITTGAFKISIDGGALTAVSSLSFASVTNMNGIATAITAGLVSASLSATCIWNGQAFEIISSSTGAGAFAIGTVTFSGNPAANDTLTLGGTAITFVASSPTGNQVVIGVDQATTFANLLAFLQASLDTNLSKCNYAATASNVITLTYKTVGVGGNAFTTVKSSSSLAVSGATLSGGTAASLVSYAVAPASGADISALLKLTSTTAQALVSGYNIETPVQAAAALASKSTVWYGLMFAATAPITSVQYLAVSSFIEALDVTRMFGVTTQDTGALSALVTNDLASLMKTAAYDQSMIQYSSASPYAIASMFGRMFSVDFNVQNSTIELMYKKQPDVAAEDLNDTAANALQSKNCNVYIGYDNDTAIIQYGVLSSGNFIDEVWGLDWFQNAVQTAVYNLFYTAQTKIPQTNAGQNQILNSISAVCGNQPGGAVYNGLAGPGTWNSSTVFGSLTTGQYLPLGYYVFAPSVDIQSEADRAQRIAPATQIALKLAGAFQEADVIVTVNQ